MKRLKGKIKLTLVAFFFILASGLLFAKPVVSQDPFQTIYIQPDGMISPKDVPIQRNGDTYTLTSDIYAAIKIQKSNIVINGAGYTLNGPYNGSSSGLWIVGDGADQNASTTGYIIGVDTTNVDGITVENLNIRNFSIGMYVWTKNNTVVGNSVSNCIVGILLSGSNTRIIGNYLSNNQMGLFFGFNTPGDIPNDITISQNSFYQNKVQLQGCKCKVYNLSEPIHNWDNGQQGNYWSDYNGTDINHDSLGDTPYTIDPLDQDRYPLMQSQIQPPVPVATTQVPIIAIAGVILLLVTGAGTFVIVRWRARRQAEREDSQCH